MATISFYGNVTDESQDLIDHTAGSGIGFFGSQFGVPVAITETQQTTWVTTENGGNAGNQLNNTSMYSNPQPAQTTEEGKVKINGADPINLSKLPNYLTTLNIRFEHESPVIASQPKIVIWDRTSITNYAVDVITYVYEARHPLSGQDKTNLSHRGKAANHWTSFDPAAGGDPIPMSLTSSPGPSGLNSTVSDTGAGTDYFEYLSTLPNVSATDFNKGSAGTFMRHDWYVALSSSPIEIGQKTEYGLYFTVDYL